MEVKYAMARGRVNMINIDKDRSSICFKLISFKIAQIKKGTLNTYKENTPLHKKAKHKNKPDKRMYAGCLVDFRVK